MTAGKKRNVELVVFIIATVLTVAGAALCLTGLLLPNWYEYNYIQGIVKMNVKLGLWQDEVCDGQLGGCNNFWITDDDYSRSSEHTMPAWELIRDFETAATAIALLATFALIPLWVCYSMGSSKFFRNLSYILYYTPTMISAFLAVVGCLIIASKGDQDFISWAPFFPGVGGALLFIAGCMGCVVCRYDPSYGTLENPVSPQFTRA